MTDARPHHLDQVNYMLRRPSMYSRDETAEILLLEAMAAVDGALTEWRGERDRLRDSGAFVSTGVMGACRHLLPRDTVRDAAASVYAESAHRFGWLRLDRTLTADEFTQLKATVEGWAAQDRTFADVTAAFGPPSVRIGPSGRSLAKTLVYATSDDLVCFHLSDSGAKDTDAVVLAVRHRSGKFPDAFTFTPEGQRRRPVAPGRDTVWVFRGGDGTLAFPTRDDGVAWAAEQNATGALVEYSPGIGHVHLVDGRPE